jgi:hypothetical protein
MLRISLLRPQLIAALIGCFATVWSNGSNIASAQSASVSAWSAANFRSWSFIPYWISPAEVTSFGTDRVYEHVSDVVYHSGVQPRADGSLFTGSTAATHLSILKNHQAQFGFRYHLDMYDAVRNSGETAAQAVERVWNAITGHPTTRATFINNVENVLVANNMTGFNMDWERPDTVSEWGHYTQLAREMQAAFPESWEVSVDDYGSTSSLWDDSPLFDARVFDQIGIMAYHYTVNSQAAFANGKKNLDDQGPEKAFKDSQIIIGMGTWGDGAQTVSLKNVVAANPNLPPDASSYTGTVVDLNGVSRTGTWDLVSRYEVRDNVQLALDRGMAGVMWWALHYDARNKFSLMRVAQHYAMFKRGVPDLNLDGVVNIADASTLADNMGTVPGWKGTATKEQFENFYMSGNWEKGDRDGNGFVNQQDADWLAGRYAALGVALPDRLAYSGTFERLADGVGVSGRWQAVRNAANQLPETGNYAQQTTGGLSFTGSGPGAEKHASSSVTIRNQNGAEAFDGLNTQPRTMQATLSEPIELGQGQETYITFLVRQNTTPLSAAQLASPNRTLRLELLDGAGQSQYDFAFFGQQTDFGIRSQTDAAGEDVSADGFDADATYLFVGKISGNGAAANILQASLFAEGSLVGNFTDPIFPWMLTATGGDGVNPLITELQLKSLYEANFTVSNLWVGSAETFFSAPATGDFNADGAFDQADLARWQSGFGMTEGATHWQGDADNDGDVDGADLMVWQNKVAAASRGASAAVPEPTGWMTFVGCALTLAGRGSRRLNPSRRPCGANQGLAHSAARSTTLGGKKLNTAL